MSRSLERNPAAAAAIKASGFDVFSHGWRWIKHFMLSEEEERDHIAKVVACTKTPRRDSLLRGARRAAKRVSSLDRKSIAQTRFEEEYIGFFAS